MTAIAASSAGVKDMADGSLRITLEFEPRFAKDAFALFGVRGTQVAIAALKDGTYIEQQAQPEKPKGGELARLAGIWCNEPKFWRWVNASGFTAIDNDMQAAAYIRSVCEVESRAELDNNDRAGMRFQEMIRLPYMAYLRANP